MGVNRKRGVQGKEETPKLGGGLKRVSSYLSFVGLWWLLKLHLKGLLRDSVRALGTARPPPSHLGYDGSPDLLLINCLFTILPVRVTEGIRLSMLRP